MVTRQIRKDAAGKTKATDTLLMNCVRTAFHKGVLTSFVGHTAQKAVEFYGVGSGMIGRKFLAVNVIAHSGAKTALVAERTEHLIKQRRYGCLSVGTRYAHQFRRRVGSP